MAKQLICQACRILGEKIDMIKEKEGYFHLLNCHNEYIEHKKFKEKERIAKDKLSYKIADIYGLDTIQMIPDYIFQRIENIRNDSSIWLGKKYKEGIPFSGIEYTFEFCREAIIKSRYNPNLNFDGLTGEILYGLKIVKNNLADAKRDSEKKRLIEQSLLKTREIEEVVQADGKKPQYKKEEDIHDISDYLD
jgi:hypothetical protein